MKFIMVLGGLIGFGIGAGFSWAQGSPWPSALWRSAATALMGGLLLRWWGRLWVNCLRDAQAARKTAGQIKSERIPTSATK